MPENNEKLTYTVRVMYGREDMKLYETETLGAALELACSIASREPIRSITVTEHIERQVFAYNSAPVSAR